MDKVTIIIVFSSIGFLLMGSFILCSKTVKSIMVTEENYSKCNKFIKRNGYLNIFVGVIGIFIAIVNSFNEKWTKILIIIFIIMIVILYSLQYILGKKYRN